MKKKGWILYFKGKNQYFAAFGGCAQLIISVSHERNWKTDYGLQWLFACRKSHQLHKLHQVTKADTDYTLGDHIPVKIRTHRDPQHSGKVFLWAQALQYSSLKEQSTAERSQRGSMLPKQEVRSESPGLLQRFIQGSEEHTGQVNAAQCQRRTMIEPQASRSTWQVSCKLLRDALRQVLSEPI